MTNAQNLLNNRDGDDSLFNQIVAAYVAIKNKSVKSSFHAYVTGYPAFFNVDTELCNDVTYYYLPPWWNPGYHPNHDYGDPSLYLTQDKRLGLNNLLQSLNGFLQDAVNTANGQIGSQVFTFVDTNAPFDGESLISMDLLHCFPDMYIAASRQASARCMISSAEEHTIRAEQCY